MHLLVVLLLFLLLSDHVLEDKFDLPLDNVFRDCRRRVHLICSRCRFFCWNILTVVFVVALVLMIPVEFIWGLICILNLLVVTFDQAVIEILINRCCKVKLLLMLTSTAISGEAQSSCIRVCISVASKVVVSIIMISSLSIVAVGLEV